MGTQEESFRLATIALPYYSSIAWIAGLCMQVPYHLCVLSEWAENLPPSIVPLPFLLRPPSVSGHVLSSKSSRGLHQVSASKPVWYSYFIPSLTFPAYAQPHPYVHYSILWPLIWMRLVFGYGRAVTVTSLLRT
jgi:hypothetical protein